MKQYNVSAVLCPTRTGSAPHKAEGLQLWQSASVGHWCIATITKRACPEAAEAWALGYASGARAVIQGLKAKPELNGKHATVIGLKTEAQRLFVQPDREAGEKDEGSLSLKAENLARA